MYKQLLTITTLVFLSQAGLVVAQQPIIYPGKGQSEQQMEKDKFECYSWAKKQTNYDPMNPPKLKDLEAKARQQAQGQQQAQTESSAVGRGVSSGIVRGAIIGEVVSDDPGKGAAIGGFVGGIRGAQRAEQQKSAQAQAQEQAIKQSAQTELNSMRNTYNRAHAACLEGRGYTVK